MIFKNVDYAATSGVTLLEFGLGDICMMCIEANDTDGGPLGGLIFKATEPHPIGHDDASVLGKTTDDIQPEVIMTFSKVESIDVLIERLQMARSQFVERLAAARQ